MSMRKLLRAKIHRLTVTGADVSYEGSLTLPPDLMQIADILPYESVQVWNVTRGTRLETYAIRGLDGSRDVCANGAAAHLVFPGDQIIVATFSFFSAAEVAQHQPKLLFVDHQNMLKYAGPEIPGPQRREQAAAPSISQ